MFFPKQIAKGLFAVFATIFLTAYSHAGNDGQHATPQQSTMPSMDVYKSPYCGCCEKWIAHIEKNGFKATAHNMDDLSDLKREKGILPQYQSCHTAISKDGFVFEGHVPAKYVQKFLKEKPENAIGLSAPGMPGGSAGMEGSPFTPFNILLLKDDGSSEVYAHIKTQEEQY